VVELSHDSRPIIGRGPPLGATFIALAALSIGLMVADQRYDQLERVRGWLNSAAYPVQVAVDLPFRAWDWLTGSFADRDRLRQENLEITARLRLANLQLQRFAAVEEENRRLRDMRENVAGVAERAIVASILNVDLDPFRHRVLLDKGAADGVFKGQAVLDADGIFGQVWRVNEHSSEVIMITDAEHAIPVQSNRSGVRTIAVGTGDLNRLSLPFVTVESDLKKDDLLLSTGMGGVFPPGYPVAQVTRVERTAKATFAIVEARPTAALDRNREVLLVWFKAPAPEPAPAATATAEPAGGATKAATKPAPAAGTATAATTARPAAPPATSQGTTAAATAPAAPSPAARQPTATSPAASEPAASQPAASAPSTTTPSNAPPTATPPGEGATR
jgi:rod shape-determining protein MreC